MVQRSRDEVADRQRSLRRSFSGWQPPAKQREVADRHGIGGNNPPDYDPEAPPPERVNVLRDIKEFVTQDGVRLSSRSHVRRYERSREVKQSGNDWTGSEKPAWWDEQKAKRQEQRKRRR